MLTRLQEPGRAARGRPEAALRPYLKCRSLKENWVSMIPVVFTRECRTSCSLGTYPGAEILSKSLRQLMKTGRRQVFNCALEDSSKNELVDQRPFREMHSSPVRCTSLSSVSAAELGSCCRQAQAGLSPACGSVLEAGVAPVLAHCTHVETETQVPYVQGPCAYAHGHSGCVHGKGRCMSSAFCHFNLALSELERVIGLKIKF